MRACVCLNTYTQQDCGGQRQLVGVISFLPSRGLQGLNLVHQHLASTLKKGWVVLVHAFNPSTRVQDSQGYTDKLYIEKQTKNIF